MGNTLEFTDDDMENMNHPHIHGEHEDELTVHGGITGSPPHTWGTPSSLIIANAPIRITPTYMGNTQHLLLHLIV